MVEEPGRLSLNLLLQKLDFIEDYWNEVGETLNVSDKILYELQKSSQANASPEKNLKVVIIEWIEANQTQVILPLILKALRDAQFVRENSMLLDKLNNLQVPYRMNARRKCAWCPAQYVTMIIDQYMLGVLITATSEVYVFSSFWM